MEGRIGIALVTLGIARALSEISRGDREKSIYTRVFVAEYHSRNCEFGRWAGLMALNPCHTFGGRFGPIYYS